LKVDGTEEHRDASHCNSRILPIDELPKPAFVDLTPIEVVMPGHPHLTLFASQLLALCHPPSGGDKRRSAS
jgi:hypothetical protein